MKDRPKRRFVIFGATGSIGSAISNALEERGAIVNRVSRGQTLHTNEIFKCDVTKIHDCADLVGALPTHEGIDAIIYAVGCFPPGGFDEAIQVPLQSLTGEDLREQYDVHVLGLQNVLTHFISQMTKKGRIIVVSSAATRFMNQSLPSGWHADPYILAKLGQDALVERWRNALAAQRSGVRLHLLKPAAVESRLYECSTKRPQSLIPMTQVVAATMTMLDSPYITDMVLIPQV